MKLIKLSIYLVLIAIIIFLVTRKTAPVLNDPVRMVESPGTFTSMPFSEFRKVLPARFQYIKDESSFLEPYDKDKLALVENSVPNVTDEQLIALLYCTPNMGLGQYRLEPITTLPANVTSFQFEQGMMGWFWFYGTFIDSAGNTASYMYYIFRLDMFSPDLRAKLNLPMGSTTYYYIASGVGKGNEWSYSPFKICRGEYKIQNDSVFSFTGLDLPQRWSFTLNSTGVGKFNISSYWLDSTSKNQGFVADIKTARQPFFNGPQGCAPCEGGAGSLYFSYTQLHSSAALTVNDSVSNHTNGTGWLDRQWLNGQISTIYLNLLSNSMGMFKEATGGLGKYVWLNLHLNDSLQYMLYNFFPLDSPVVKGTQFTTTQNRYGAKPEWGLTGAAEVLETKELAGITFPIKYKLAIREGTVILSAEKFSKSISIDPSNNVHWDGSGIIYDSTGTKMIGTGFFEANEFAAADVYTSNLLQSIGLPVTSDNLQMFGTTSQLTVSQGLPSLIVTILIILALLILVILFIKEIFHKSKPKIQKS
jgi:hypothetical protein